MSNWKQYYITCRYYPQSFGNLLMKFCCLIFGFGFGFESQIIFAPPPPFLAKIGINMKKKTFLTSNHWLFPKRKWTNYFISSPEAEKGWWSIDVDSVSGTFPFFLLAILKWEARMKYYICCQVSSYSSWESSTHINMTQGQ